MRRNKLWLLLIISGVIFSAAICLPKEKIPTAGAFFAGTWQGRLSGEGSTPHMPPCGSWETGFKMDILNLKVAERQKIPGHAIFSRAVSGWVTVHYNTPKWIKIQQNCQGKVEMKSRSITGQIEGEILTLEWGAARGETAWCLDISDESQKRLAPEGTWTITCNGRAPTVINGSFASGEILGFVYPGLNSGHMLDFTINRKDNSIALHEEEAPLPLPFSIPNVPKSEYNIDGILYGVHHEPFDFNNLPPNGLVETDEHTIKEIDIPDVGEVIMNTNSECKFKSDKLLEQFKGKLFFKVQKLEPQQLKIRTPQSICGVRETEVVSEVEEDGTSKVTVLEGSVEFSDLNKKKTVVVKKNQTSVVKPGGLPSEPVHINPGQIPRWWE